MARAVKLSYKVYRVTLSDVDIQTLQLHAERNDMAQTEAMEDMLHTAFRRITREMDDEERDSYISSKVPTIGGEVCVCWHEESSLPDLDETDKGFIRAWMQSALRECVYMVNMGRSFKGVKHGMEREDEGMGSSLSNIPQYGRGSGDVHRDSGTGKDDGEVQEQATGPDSLPGSDG